MSWDATNCSPRCQMSGALKLGDSFGRARVYGMFTKLHQYDDTGSNIGMMWLQSSRMMLWWHGRRIVKLSMHSFNISEVACPRRDGRRRGNAKAQRGSARGARCIDRVRMPSRPLFGAVSASAATTTRTSTRACGAPAYESMARGSAKCGVARATPTLRHCAVAARSATITVFVAQGSPSFECAAR